MKNIGEGLNMGKLPKYNINKQTGNVAADLLKSKLQKISIINTHAEEIDLGIDMRGQIIIDQEPKPLFYNVQCKGTSKEDIFEQADEYSITIKVETVNFWMQQNEITFLILVDTNTEECYWANPFTQLEKRYDEIQTQKSITIKVPKKNILEINSQHFIDEFLRQITIYKVKSIKWHVDTLDEIKSSIVENKSLDIAGYFEIIKILSIEGKKINDKQNQIITALIDKILEAYNNTSMTCYKLNQIPLVRIYCREDLFETTGFSNKNNNIKSVKLNIEYLLKKINNKYDINIITELENQIKELETILSNVVAFFREMVCEDNPFGNHELLHKAVEECLCNKKLINLNKAVEVIINNY